MFLCFLARKNEWLISLSACSYERNRIKERHTMVVNVHKTLYDAIRDKAAFKRLLHDAIAHSLAQLGDRIYDLEWANMRARTSVERMAA